MTERRLTSACAEGLKTTTTTIGEKLVHTLKSILKLGVALAALNTLRAYLDPGSGSLIVQLLIAIIVGIAATFRLWKARLLSLFGIKRETEDDVDADDVEARDLS